jgi:hypothetical protein
MNVGAPRIDLTRCVSSIRVPLTYCFAFEFYQKMEHHKYGEAQQDQKCFKLSRVHVLVDIHQKHKISNGDILGQVFDGRPRSYEQKHCHLEHIDVEVVVIINISRKSGIKCDGVPERVTGRIHHIVDDQSCENAEYQACFRKTVAVKISSKGAMGSHLPIQLRENPWVNLTSFDAFVKVDARKYAKHRALNCDSDEHAIYYRYQSKANKELNCLETSGKKLT